MIPTNLISKYDSMPGDSLECLFIIECWIDFKKEYQCGDNCHPQIRFYTIEMIDYLEDLNKIGEIENGIFISFEFEVCSKFDNDYEKDMAAHKIKPINKWGHHIKNMSQAVKLSNKKITHWGIKYIDSWLPFKADKYNDKTT